MIKLRPLFLVGVLVSLIAQAAQHPGGPSQALIRTAWRDACTWSHYDCTGVRPPRARYNDGLYARRVAGEYLGKGVVFIRRDLGRFDKRAILAHEMVHYLQDVHGYDPPYTHEMICSKIEREAWAVSNFLLHNANSEWYAPDWEIRYGCGGRLNHGPVDSAT